MMNYLVFIHEKALCHTVKMKLIL